MTQCNSSFTWLPNTLIWTVIHSKYISNTPLMNFHKSRPFCPQILALKSIILAKWCLVFPFSFIGGWWVFTDIPVYKDNETKRWKIEGKVPVKHFEWNTPNLWLATQQRNAKHRVFISQHRVFSWNPSHQNIRKWQTPITKRCFLYQKIQKERRMVCGLMLTMK